MAVQSPTFGLLVKRHRLAAGMTQEELAERAGVSVRAIGDLERCLRQPRKDTLQMLLETLQLAPDEAARLEVAAHASSAGYPLGAFGAGAGEPLLQTGSFLGTLPPGPLIGRQQEVTRIVAAVDAVIGGGGRLVLLAGEPGIGKTRLAQQTALEASKRGFLVVSGRCYEPEQDVPFYPFLEALATAYDRVPRAIRDDIPHRWTYLGALLPEDVFQVWAPAHGAWSTGLGEQQRLFRGVGGFSKAVSEAMPVAVLLDDLHWADDASLKLLLHLARHSRGERLLLLGTYRDVEVGPHHLLQRALVDLNRERLLERVVLHRLDRASTDELIVATMGGTDVCPELQTMIYNSTDGNPFFVQEVLRELVERGELVRQDGRAKHLEIQELRVPETVQAVIQQRLLHLDSNAQVCLIEASVLGQTFSFEDLQALGHHSAEELDEALQAGVAAGLLREADADRYAFNHALAQQALYTDVSTQRRQRLHLAAGEALHHLPDRVRARRAAELARHFRQGGDRGRATAYSMLAGKQAVGLYAYKEAERHFRVAVELLMPEEPAPADVSLVPEALTKLGRVLDITEGYDEALATLEQAAELYRTQGNLEGEGRVVAEIGWIHRNRGTDEEGLGRLQPVVDTLEREGASSGERGALAALYAALARVFFGLGRYVDELAAAERAVQLARDSGDGVVLAVAEARRGTALMTFGRRREAREALEAAIALAEATGDLATATVALDNLGEIARDGGDYHQSRQDFERAVKLAEQIGVPGRIGWPLTKLGRIHLLQGDWPRARAIFERALRLLGDDPRLAAYARVHLGQLDLLEGNWETGSAQVEAAMRAEAHGRDLWLRWHGQRLLAERDLLDGQPAAALARLTPLVEQTGGRAPRGTIIFTLLFAALAWAYLELDQEGQAETVLTEGMARAHAQNHRLAQADLLRVQGMLRTRQGRWQGAWDALEEAISLAHHMPDPYREAQARAEAGRLAARTGKGTQARDQLREALAIASRLGAHPSIRHFLRSLAELGRAEERTSLKPSIAHRRETSDIERRTVTA